MRSHLPPLPHPPRPHLLSYPSPPPPTPSPSPSSSSSSSLKWNKTLLIDLYERSGHFFEVDYKKKGRKVSVGGGGKIGGLGFMRISRRKGFVSVSVSRKDHEFVNESSHRHRFRRLDQLYLLR
ncbi:hypothetical protein Drorol1_Dr00019389 [Drosera rotundifolia]